MSTEVMLPQEEAMTQALTVHESGGVMALALMSEKDFEARLAAMKKGQERVQRIQRELMVPEVDFGKIPGTDKPTLLKPGAEKLCAVYGLKGTFEKRELVGDGVSSPHLRISMTCYLRRGEDGPIVAQGEGAANSWERKHRYRSQKRACPACGTEGSIRKSKFPDKKTGDIGWWCREENCKVNFPSNDSSIVGQVSGTIENPDPFEVENTLVKMALKRAYIDATLRATATSGLFAQDIEDMEHDEPAKGTAATHVEPEVVDRAPGEPPIARIPTEGSVGRTDAMALGGECLRLAGGDREVAAGILEGIAGRKTLKGMKASDVMAAWSKLAVHPTFGNPVQQ